MSESLFVELRANNSSGEQKLHLTYSKETRDSPEEFDFTLTGVYKGEKIQIDFDSLSKQELEDIKALIECILELSKK